MDGAALVLVNGGAVAHLNALRSTWLWTLKVGLFQNNWEPQVHDSIDQVVPATFSGYGGLHDLYGWRPAALFGNLAVTAAGPNFWTHDGGAVGNWIFGYYVVDLLGVLQWAQRKLGDPYPMESGGQIFRVLPKYAVGSRFSE